MVLRIFIALSLIVCANDFSFAQQAIIELENDDTLPIASSRFDDAVEPPKDNFSSVNKNDVWEKFERGELDQKAFIKLQEEYQAAASNSKDPFVKRKIASEKRRKKILEARKAKARAKLVIKKKELKRQPASQKKSKLPKKK